MIQASLRICVLGLPLHYLEFHFPFFFLPECVLFSRIPDAHLVLLQLALPAVQPYRQKYTRQVLQ